MNDHAAARDRARQPRRRRCAPPRFKKVFLLDLSRAAANGGYVGKTLLLDLLAIPDPIGVGGDGDFFRLPFYTIESVHVVDRQTLLVASDNNFPFSSGRARGPRPGPRAARSPPTTPRLDPRPPRDAPSTRTRGCSPSGRGSHAVKTGPARLRRVVDGRPDPAPGL